MNLNLGCADEVENTLFEKNRQQFLLQSTAATHLFGLLKQAESSNIAKHR